MSIVAPIQVLLVEDDADLRAAFYDVLALNGYSVLQAANGQEALDILNRAVKKPDIILLDLMMPVMDGYKFREEQRKDPRYAHIPVVVMSADGRVEEKLKRVGGHAYLKKPTGIRELLEAIRRFATT
ncbi:MAG: response regulator [Bdellovibrionales bacterium]|nr:response regulator [Bdellovibrionales bacterium]